jgi:hypothetical protein
LGLGRSIHQKIGGKSLSGASDWNSSLNIIQWIKWRRIWGGGEGVDVARTAEKKNAHRILVAKHEKRHI